MYSESVTATASRIHVSGTPIPDRSFERTRVLVVEPDASLGAFLKRELSMKGFHVNLCRDGEHAMQEVSTSSYDLVIQDLNLPTMDGMSLLHSLSATCPSLPVMVLTARSRTEDLVRALDWGAHDYIVKPFSLLELQARMRNLVRRASIHALLPPSPKAGSQLFMSKQDRRVIRGSRKIDLTPREFALLEQLAGNEGKAVSRSQLMQDVWNAPFDPSNNIVDVYMKYLRDKIDGEGEPKLIRTVRGVGYMLDSSAGSALIATHA